MGAEEAPAAAQSVAQADEAGKEKLSMKYVTSLVQRITDNIIDSDGAVNLDDALMDSGLDSLSAINFRNTLTKELGLKLPGTLMFDYPTMRGVAEHLYEVGNE